MNEFSLVQIVRAASNAEAPARETTTETVVQEESAHGEGITIQPTTVAFQALNFVILLALLQFILYKPLVKLLDERGKRIKDGVENAEKAELMLKESNMVRQDMLKRTSAETQELMEKARVNAEGLKNTIITDAHNEAGKIIESGQALVDMEREKTMQDMKAMAVNMVVKAAEKILREKIDGSKDAQLIQESINSYSA